MTQSEIETVLISVVRELQALSGRVEVNVTKDTCPLNDMPGFDSLNGVEATIEVVDRLKIKIEDNDIFAENGNALTIAAAGARILIAMGNS